MATNYNKIAGVYDFISRVIFGKNLVRAQVCLLAYVPANSKILIVGGGTGWILEEFAKLHPNGLMIDYVESSSKMIALSKQRNCGNNQIDFINLPVENFMATEKYDIILTPFLFDNFQSDKIQNIFTRLNSFIKHDGNWLYVDFVYDKDKSPLWQKLLLKLMYFFFRVTTKIETQQLINMDSLFDPWYNRTIVISHFHHFIQSIVYKKR